jgi:magnesium transporter
MPHALFGPELKVMLADDDAAGLKAFCDSVHPATAAEALDDAFTAAEIWRVISQADVRTQAAIFEYLPLAKQIEVVESHREGVARLIEKMSHDDRVDLLRRLPARVSEALLRLVDEADRRDIATLFKYGETTVGAIMTTDYAWLPQMLTAAEAVDQLRQQAPDRETIYYVYVLDEPRKRPDGGAAPRKLLGALSLRDLILAPRFTLVRDLMEDELVTLNFQDDQEKAAQVLARYDFIAVPVVDDAGGMLGIVTHDDVLDVVQEEATEDIQKQGGVSPLGQRYVDAGFLKIWWSRASWLAVLFLAELGTFTVLSYYQDAIAAVVVLALFVPLCLSVGGNSGSQASTLITRSLALGEITPRQWARVLRRELLMGLALGVTLGLIALARGALTPSDTRSGPEKVKYPFSVTLPPGAALGESKGEDVFGDPYVDYVLPPNTAINRTEEKGIRVRLPDGASPPAVAGQSVEFPADCETRTEPISRWQLGKVIALAVMAICLWGSMVGATLPLIFRSIGMDPAVASGPFVATFVDLTGLFIYFQFAKGILLGG